MGKMDPKVKSKINRIAAESHAIARELEEIAEGIAREFKGIGVAQCSSSLQGAAQKYHRVSSELRRI
ncbi:hypothetical protein [Mesobacillus foraminis]|uniref:Uncharacterized protein n=1 Tax=Mesobacillus foraminis TaxID=279826 RepID=A0A4R2BE42_9BACI|nr:hypothetical protein [Mesobacillus foraminis]TCN24104.1 hypothetical protein EV146_108214 [Mesobacillus foraminis]